MKFSFAMLFYYSKELPSRQTEDKDSMENDYRNYLFESFVKVVKYYRPKTFVFENVAGLLSAKPNGGKLPIASLTVGFMGWICFFNVE